MAILCWAAKNSLRGTMTFYENVLQQFKMEKADFFANFKDTREAFAQNIKSLKATLFLHFLSITFAF